MPRSYDNYSVSTTVRWHMIFNDLQKMPMQQGPIWIVDDDEEDHELVQDIFKELDFNDELALFKSGEDLIARLEQSGEAPFIIISDVNLPRMDGFELRELLLSRPNKKFHSVPFIFWSTRASEAQIQHAYELKAHGFFIKEP